VPRVTSTLIRLTAAGLAAALLAGCSGEVSIGTNSVSAEKIERDIRGAYEAQTNLELTRLTCESAKAEVSSRIDCDGRNSNDVVLTISGQITKVNDDDVNYNWTVVKAVAPGTLFAPEIGRLLERRYGPVVAEVTCPDRIDVKKGQEVSCRATAKNGDAGTAVIVLTDGNGNFTLKSFDGSRSRPSGEGA
jgi:hypothetical protein